MTTAQTGHLICLQSWFFASLQPLFDQVFIVWVATRTQWHGSETSELACVGVNEYRYEAIFLLQIVNLFIDFEGNLSNWRIFLSKNKICTSFHKSHPNCTPSYLFVNVIASAPRQVPEFQLNCCHFTRRAVRWPFRWMCIHTGQIHIRIRYTRRWIKARQQSIAQVRLKRNDIDT